MNPFYSESLSEFFAPFLPILSLFLTCFFVAWTVNCAIKIWKALKDDGIWYALLDGHHRGVVPLLCCLAHVLYFGQIFFRSLGSM